MIFVAISLFLTAMSCEKYPDGLPPETAEGKNTFGCLVNNEIFTDSNAIIQWGIPNLWATYIRNTNSIEISARRRKNEKTEYVWFTITNPIEMLPAKIDSAGYSKGCYPDCPCPSFIGKNTGSVILTRFDTVNKIVSGRFSFDGICSDINRSPIGDSAVHITEGRFDIDGMLIYDN